MRTEIGSIRKGQSKLYVLYHAEDGCVAGCKEVVKVSEEFMYAFSCIIFQCEQCGFSAGHLLGSCTAAPGSTEDSHGHPGNAAVRQALHALVLMECIQQPQLRSEAASTLMQSIAQGRLGDKEVSVV